MRIARVFPRRTSATPTDNDAYVGPPTVLTPVYDEVHVSVTFTWDLPAAEDLACRWEGYGMVRIGGPATGMRGEAFVPGMYVKHGLVITSRGCPNNCWFCSVPKRDGGLRELAIADGNNVLDDNLLACSDRHFEKVCRMLDRQPDRPKFTGGLEAKRFMPCHALILRAIRTKQLFFAYDTPDDWEPLVRAVDLCWQAKFTPASHAVWCYCLMGYKGDTVAAAERRLRQVVALGVMPYPMLWRNEYGKADPEWMDFKRQWVTPQVRKARGVMP